jgi:hypothetical protein
MNGAVYDPPRSGLPHVAVIFDDDGTVVTAQECFSVQDGESLIEHLKEMVAKDKPKLGKEWDEEPIDQ